MAQEQSQRPERRSRVEVARWRRSPHGGESGGMCVEIAQWSKSSYSHERGAVRDLKDAERARLVSARVEWAVFAQAVKDGRRSLPFWSWSRMRARSWRRGGGGWGVARVARVVSRVH
ncbi:DUF397 domain-containing protein [Actinomadura sp. NPDC047616]|uniref:DUF397 domain-containing protein n=1 Tax=Actinomadura sp. NPDC047616 TaxID=3155914 RepID=UPI0033C5EDA1